MRRIAYEKTYEKNARGLYQRWTIGGNSCRADGLQALRREATNGRLDPVQVISRSMRGGMDGCLDSHASISLRLPGLGKNGMIDWPLSYQSFLHIRRSHLPSFGIRLKQTREL